MNNRRHEHCNRNHMWESTVVPVPSQRVPSTFTGTPLVVILSDAQADALVRLSVNTRLGVPVTSEDMELVHKAADAVLRAKGIDP